MKKRDLIFAIFFLSALALASAALTFAPKSDFSTRERRNLSALPAFTLNGGFDEKIEKYAADHFPGRDALVGVNAYFNLITGRDGLSGAYLGRDGYVFAAPARPDDENFSKNAAAIAAIVKNSGLPARVIAPLSKGAALAEFIIGPRENYPDARYLAALAQIDGAEIIDVGNIEYYKTDHHWTSRGAFSAYRALIGEAASDESDYSIEVYPGFYGTTLAKSGYFLTAPDEIELWTNAFNASAFHRDKLSTYDMYAAFLGGDEGVARLSNPSAPDARLMIIKDSFADALAPFLMEHYREIILIDPRYARGLDLIRLIADEGIDELLFVYCVESLINDSSLQFMKGY